MMSFYLRDMSFIDMAYLKKIDLKNSLIVYRRRKTGQQLTIAWTSEMQFLLDKYRFLSDFYDENNQFFCDGVVVMSQKLITFAITIFNTGLKS